MLLLSFLKENLAKGTIFSLSTVTSTWGTYWFYEEVSNTYTSDDNIYKVKNVNDDNFKDAFSNYFCFEGRFGEDYKEEPFYSSTTSQEDINLGDDDFLSNMDKVDSACFTLRTEKRSNSVVGYAELTSVAFDDFVIVMQSEINLSKDNLDPNSYFISKLSFFRKDRSKNAVWKLDKALAWQEDKVSYEEMIDAPKYIFKWWSPKEEDRPEWNDSLFRKFYFLQESILWRDNYDSGFAPSKFFAYKNGKWHNNLKINNSEWYKKIPKGKWEPLVSHGKTKS